MNKEVIYLEPEDDITDILTKLQQAEQKVVALVPPKKASILRSAVNMKLVARVAKECEKVAVIVTADPAIIKMAMGAKIPVAKTLQSRPVVPTEENIKKADALEDVIDEDALEEDMSDKKSKKSNKAESAKPDAASVEKNELQLDEDSLEGEEAKNKAKQKAKKKAQRDTANQNFFQKNRKYIVAGAIAAVALIVVLVWAFVFAPAVKITLAIGSTPNNFSENVRFTTDENAENLAENLLYVERVTLDKTYKANFEATGEEDRGNKASGRLTVTVEFVPRDYMGQGGYGIYVEQGAQFRNENNGLLYVATAGDSKGWDGEDTTVYCDNGTVSTGSGLSRTCRLSVTVPVEAQHGGEEYNISAGSSWSNYTSGNAAVSNGSPIAGGTTDMVTVISEDDINKLKETQLSEHTLEGKEDVVSSVGRDLVIIESSFTGEVTNVKTTPEMGEEVKSGNTPSAELEVTYSVYAVKKSTIEKFVDSKAEVVEGQKIYAYGEPYFERFTDLENEARLKTTYETGPIVTEEGIWDKIKGLKTGQVAAALRSIDGVSSVDIQTSYFWVWSVPTDPNKVTIEFVGEEK